VRSYLFIPAAFVLTLAAGAAFYLARAPDSAPPTPPADPASPDTVVPPKESAGFNATAAAPALTDAPSPPLPAGLAPLEEKTSYRTDTEATAVFRKAFWREPTPADRILHAERREWVGERDGVRRWQWFIALEPGPELLDWLKTRNPFSLAPVRPAAVQLDPATQPKWFPAATAELRDAEYLQSADSAMLLIFEKNTGRVYASDRGHGFAATTPPSPPVQTGAGLIPGREQPLRIPGDVRPSVQ
jgi:hypothetical protein